MSRTYKDVPWRMLFEEMFQEERRATKKRLSKALQAKKAAHLSNRLKFICRADWYEWCVESKQQAVLKQITQDMRDWKEEK